MNGSALEQLFPGGSELSRRMRAFDWASTGLDWPERWPDPLKQSVKLCLTSRFPIVMYWGPELTMLYNDAYVPFLGAMKHPAYLGRPAREPWSDIWDAISPMFERVRSTGEATWSKDFLFFFARNLPREEVYITFTIAPILLDSGAVGGFFCPCTEVTEKVIAERRLETLRYLGVQTQESKTAMEACQTAAAVLEQNLHDISFAAIYLLDDDGETARLAAHTGSPLPEEFPGAIALASGVTRWPLVDVARTRQAAHLDLPTSGVVFSGGLWPEPSNRAMVLPLMAAAQSLTAGFLIAGVNPRRVLDDLYSDFFALVASQIATAIADAEAFERERERAEALAETDRAKMQFFSSVSHELRTPLTLMLGPVEDLLSRAQETVTMARADLELVRRNARRLLKLVNTLLDFSRIEAGRMQAFYESVDLSAFTAELVSVFRSAIEKAGLRLSVDCPPLNEVVFVDRGMWEKIVMNLLSNALKFTFEGEIAISLRRNGDRVDLSVRDTGTGIPEGELPLLFERFHRIEGARGRTHEGSGIGLALVQELATLHGGSVRAESVYGRGSQFTVSIPLAQAYLPPHGTLRRAGPSGGAAVYVQEALRWLPEESRGARTDREALPPEGTRARILFADDNADLRHYIERLLRPLYDVQLAADSEAAFAAALDDPPDLVLTDVMMPVLDGLGLVRALRSDPRTRMLPVIVLTARADDAARVEGLSAGADDFLIKPFSARELRQRIAGLLERARANRNVLEREQRLRRTAEEAEARTREELESELEAMTRLHQLSTRLVRETELKSLLDEVLDATMALQNAPMGSVQRYDPAIGALEIVAQRGLSPELAQHYGAVQSTSLFSRHGDPLGVISTYFRDPHHPSDREVRLTELYARQAAEMIESKQREEALRACEERFRRYFDLGLIGMATTSPSKGILEVNDELCRILGYERDELVRMDWAQVTHPDDLAADLAEFNRVIAGEIDGYSLDKRWIRKDGRIIDSIMSAKCVRREDGSVDYFVGLVQDITERKLAESQRTLAEDALAAARLELSHVIRVTTMGELAASIAHEVNQPLAAVITNGHACARWLAAMPPNLAEANSALSHIIADANRASEVIARIRTFLGRAPSSRMAVDIEEVMAEVITIVQARIRAQQVSVQSVTAAGVPPVAADRVQLQQVLLNLVLNAIEAMSAVGDRPRVLRLQADPYGPHEVLVCVEDSGVGLKPGEHDHIFDPFFTTKTSGMGMGLTISRSIVESHGGRLWATANQDYGVTFQFVVPAAPARASPGPGPHV